MLTKEVHEKLNKMPIKELRYFQHRLDFSKKGHVEAFNEAQRAINRKVSPKATEKQIKYLNHLVFGKEQVKDFIAFFRKLRPDIKEVKCKRGIIRNCRIYPDQYLNNEIAKGIIDIIDSDDCSNIINDLKFNIEIPSYG